MAQCAASSKLHYSSPLEHGVLAENAQRLQRQVDSIRKVLMGLESSSDGKMARNDSPRAGRKESVTRRLFFSSRESQSTRVSASCAPLVCRPSFHASAVRPNWVHTPSSRRGSASCQLSRSQGWKGRWSIFYPGTKTIFALETRSYFCASSRSAPFPSRLQ